MITTIAAALNLLARRRRGGVGGRRPAVGVERRQDPHVRRVSAHVAQLLGSCRKHRRGGGGRRRREVHEVLEPAGDRIPEDGRAGAGGVWEWPD